MKKILMTLVLCFSLLGIRIKAADVDYSITNYEIRVSKIHTFLKGIFHSILI